MNPVACSLILLRLDSAIPNCGSSRSDPSLNQLTSPQKSGLNELAKLAKDADPDAVEMLLNLSAITQPCALRQAARAVLREIKGSDPVTSRSVREVVAQQARELVKLRNYGAYASTGETKFLHPFYKSLELMPEISETRPSRGAGGVDDVLPLCEADFASRPANSAPRRRAERKPIQNQNLFRAITPTSSQGPRSAANQVGSTHADTPDLTDEDEIRETFDEISAARQSGWYERLFCPSEASQPKFK